MTVHLCCVAGNSPEESPFHPSKNVTV